MYIHETPRSWSRKIISLYISRLALKLTVFRDMDRIVFTNLRISTGLILGLHPANERRRHKVTPSLIGWAQT